MSRANHICEAPNYCICRSNAMEPNELCPKHGIPKKPVQCVYCNKFMSVSKSISLVDIFKTPKEIKGG